MLISINSAGEEQGQIDQMLAEPVTQLSSAFWQYPKPAIILGRSQPISDDLASRANGLGIEIVRRSSGGGAVMAGPWMLGGVVTFPNDHSFSQLSLPDSFERVGAIWQSVLRNVAVETELVCRENREEKIQSLKNNGLEWVCFAGLSHGELTDTSNRKILGLAQVRKRNGIAVVIGLLNKPPQWDVLLDVWHGDNWRHADIPSLDDPIQSLKALTSSIDEQLNGMPIPPMAQLVESFEQALHETFGPIRI